MCHDSLDVSAGLGWGWGDQMAAGTFFQVCQRQCSGKRSVLEAVDRVSSTCLHMWESIISITKGLLKTKIWSEDTFAAF